MFPQIFLVLSLCISTVLPISFCDSAIHNNEVEATKAPTSLPLRENQQKLNDITKGQTFSTAITSKEITETKNPNDLTGQETFYPAGGIWWGVQPWGGWGGYRPWYGWRGPQWGGYRPWYGWRGPQWGGHWGGERLG